MSEGHYQECLAGNYYSPDFFYPSLFEGASAFIEGGAGGSDIIYEPDIFSE
jgi:hypothetical protein